MLRSSGFIIPAVFREMCTFVEVISCVNDVGKILNLPTGLEIYTPRTHDARSTDK